MYKSFKQELIPNSRQSLGTKNILNPNFNKTKTKGKS